MSGVRVPEDCGEAPEGWSWKPLTSLARLESGHTPSRRMPEWWGGNVPWLALPDIRELDGKVALKTLETTNELGLENSSARLLPTRPRITLAMLKEVDIPAAPIDAQRDFVSAQLVASRTL